MDRLLVWGQCVNQLGIRMKMQKLSVLVVCFLALTVSEAPLQSDVVTGEGALWTSLTRLLAKPELYNKKVVEVMGYYSTGREFQALFLSPEDARIGDVQSAVWINFEGATVEGVEQRSKKSQFVRVIGTFYSDPDRSYGHGGVWPSEIKNIRFFSSL
jgi:hypothetical protein